MADTIISVIVIFLTLIGLPIFILWLRDKGGILGKIIENSLGITIFLLGIVFCMIWVLIYIFNYGEYNENKNWVIAVPQLTFAIGFVIGGYQWLFGLGSGLEDVEIDFNSPELEAAKKQAIATLPIFLEEVANHIDEAYIKFPFETDSDGIEHVWGYVHSFADGVFNISMISAPFTQEGEFETRFDVLESDVEDWQIMLPDGKIQGGYSMIGAFQYLENNGKKLSKNMLKQREQLVDAQY